MMVYLRTKIVKGKKYYYIVKGNRDKNGKVQQKVIKYLGTTETILKDYKELEESRKNT